MGLSSSPTKIEINGAASCRHTLILILLLGCSKIVSHTDSTRTDIQESLYFNHLA